jgi:hypothetical protein
VNALIAILILLLLGLIVLVVGAPLRAARRGDLKPQSQETLAGHPVQATAAELEVEHDDMEAAREAKYREIRDAELDFRTGKLSREDYEAIDAQLRAEALEILNRLEPVEPPE